MSDKNKYYQKARKKYEARDFEDAVYWYSRLLTVAPDDAEIYSERGVAFFHMGDLKKALDDLSRARDLEPENPYRYSSRAYIRDAMGDLEGAIRDYEHAIKLDPEDAVAHNNLGMLEEKRGYHAKAKVLFDFADDLAEGGKNGASAEEMRPRNIQKEINGKKPENGDPKKIIKEVFTNPTTFKEFLKFIGNGFK